LTFPHLHGMLSYTATSHEASMLDEEEIDNQQRLLAAHRRTLIHVMEQAAAYGGEVFAPPQTVSGIADARTNISRIKAYLRENGIAVEDELSDVAPPQVEPVQRSGGDVVMGDKVGGDKVGGDKVMGDKRTIDTGGGDYAEGTIDKRQGVFVEGGTIYGPVVGTNMGTITTSYGHSLTNDTRHVSLDQVLAQVQHAVIRTKQQGDDDLADDLEDVVRALQAARKAQTEGKAERRSTRLREAREALRRIGAGEPSLRNLVQMLDLVK